MWKLLASLWPGLLPVNMSFRGLFTRRTQESQITTLLGRYHFEETKKQPGSKKKLFRHTAPIIETVSTELIPQISEKELVPDRVSYLTCYLKNIVFQICDVNWLCVWNINFQSGKGSPQTQKIYLQFLGNP